MAKEELIKKLEELVSCEDFEHAHAAADDLLITYINDPDIAKAYDEIGKWYA